MMESAIISTIQVFVEKSTLVILTTNPSVNIQTKTKITHIKVEMLRMLNPTMAIINNKLTDKNNIIVFLTFVK